MPHTRYTDTIIMALSTRKICLLHLSGICFIIGSLILIMNVFASRYQIIAGLMIPSMLLVSVVTYDLQRLLPDDVHYSWKSIFALYIFNLAGRILGGITYYRLQKASKHCREAQETLLITILEKNKNTEYGKKLSLCDIQTRDDYAKLVPLSNYLDIKPYVERCMEGEDGLFSVDKTVMFATTSGTTTGMRNLIPQTKTTISQFMMMGSLVGGTISHEYFPGTALLRKYTRFYFPGNLKQTPLGVTIGPVSTIASKNELLKLMNTSPEVISEVYDRKCHSYINWLFSVKDSTVGYFMGSYAVTMHNELGYLMQVWPQIISDIESGAVSTAHVQDEAIQRELNKLLVPDPQRAAHARQEFLKGTRGLVKRLWPHCSCVMTIDSGSMEIYGRLLRESFLDGMPIYSMFYPCSEALIGFNMWPYKMPRHYMPALLSTFMEFMPYPCEKEGNQQTLFLDQLEYGKDYEVIVTTDRGLYRYINGDVIRVCAFHNHCPVFEFRFRKGQILDIAGEKVTEADMLAALSKTLASYPDIKLHDYTTTTNALFDSFHTGSATRDTANTSMSESGEVAGHYVIFLELNSCFATSAANDISQKCDQALCTISEPYKRCRERQLLDAPEVYLVQQGTFAAFAEKQCADLTNAVNQFKTPRFLTKQEHVETIAANILKL